jgi:uncharacterized delta-60 repeat protein
MACVFSAAISLMAPAAALEPPPLPPAHLPFPPLVMPDGRLLVYGYASLRDSDDAPRWLAVWRFNSDGTPDKTFNGDGYAAIPVWGTRELVTSIALQSDGRIVLLGRAEDPTSAQHPCDVTGCSPQDPLCNACTAYAAIARLNVDGSLDYSFNGRGLLVLDLSDEAPPTRVGIENEGKIGLHDRDRLVVRLNADGTLDRTYNGTTVPPREYFFADAQGLWDAPSEAGWGVSMAQQGEVIFATWFTYNGPAVLPNGQRFPWWLSVTAKRIGERVYHGTLYESQGPSLNAEIYHPERVSRTMMGTATITFDDADNATFEYVVTGISQSKAITRRVFGPRPGCSFGTVRDLARAANYTDLWWAAPAGSQPGWGINLAHQGDTIFISWMTYAVDQNAFWLSGTATKTGPSTYSGRLIETLGPVFNAVPRRASDVVYSDQGPFTLTFADGNNASFHFEFDWADYNYPIFVNRTQAITRQVFNSPGTTCR